MGDADGTTDSDQSPRKSSRSPQPRSLKTALNSASQQGNSKSPRPLSKSPVCKKAKSNHPTMMVMLLEVLKENKSGKGLSLQAIKRTIIETYPESKEHFSNARLRKAVVKGLESTEIIRPKSSEETGVKGHFLLNRALATQKEKMKRQAAKAKEKKAVIGVKKVASRTSKSKERPIKTVSSLSSMSKSPAKKISKVGSKSTKAATANSKTAKSPKTVKARSKTTKSPKAIQSNSKSKTTSQKAAKAIVRKASKSKSPKQISPKKAALKKILANKSASPWVSAPAGTPKLSKSSIAGAKKKTATVKKMLKKSAVKAKAAK